MAILFFNPLWLSVAVDLKFFRPDTRELAAAWAEQVLVPGDRALMIGESAPIIITDGVHKRQISQLAEVGHEEYQAQVAEADYFLIGEGEVLSEEEVRQALEAAVGSVILVREIHPTPQPVLPPLGLEIGQRGPDIYIYSRYP